MKAPDRDLLVLLKTARHNEAEMELELSRLHTMLLNVETAQTFCHVFEVIDCNKFRVFADSRRILQTIAIGESAFVFLNNKN
ncbi:MAG TPA: hypothetical protein PLQ32_03270 [Flavihumibacter sp.]|nr:hypothetical protein [Bacteroidota bacterium]HOA36821.1 hypothetical protein [Flavihumibacter sp.]HPZ87098.1 hypothetical protein [Flavihumibacter sp.]HQD08219.1 hypothetical protein [Flavihumibacter sp.]